MADRAAVVTVAEGIKAAAFMLELPAADLDGYIVVGLKSDGDYEIGGNFRSSVHVIAVLADVIAHQLAKMADDTPPGVIV